MAYRRLHQAFKHLRFPAKSAPRISRRGRHSASSRAAASNSTGLRYGVELLENRVLLTTVSGGGVDPLTGEPLLGDVFEFRQGDAASGGEDVYRVKLRGNVTAELIGAQIDRRTNAVSLVNLPGFVTRDGQSTDVFGGIQQGTGFQTIGGISITNPSTGFPVNANIQAVAAGGPTTFYALNRANGATQIVLLTLPPAGIGGIIAGQFTGTVIGSLDAGSDPFFPPGAAAGADVQPGSGLLFFASTTVDGSTHLYSVDPNVANSATPGDEVALTLVDRGQILPPPPPPGQGQQQQQPPRLGTIAFVGARLFAVINNANGQAGGGGGGANNNRRELWEINPNNASNIISQQQITLAGQQGGGGGGQGGIQGGGDIEGLDVDTDGNVIAFLNATRNQQTGALNNDGLVLQIGQNNNPTPGASIALGQFQKDTGRALAFVPGVRDPFSSANGAFIGFDDSNNTFFFLDARDRNPAQFLYNIYVTSGDVTGEISMGFLETVAARFSDNPPPNPQIDIFGGSHTSFFTTDLVDGGDPIRVFGQGTAGGMLLGAVSQNITGTDPDEGGIAVLNANVPSSVSFGVLPPDVTSLKPGLVVENGQSLGKFLLGGTIIGGVDIRGNIDEFYAGWIATGDVNGQPTDSQSENPNNFNVEGDIRRLLTTCSIGTGAGGSIAGITQAPGLHYNTGFDLRVGGTLGTLKTYGGTGFAGSAEVDHLDPKAAGREGLTFGRNQKETEVRDIGGNRLASGLESFNLDEALFANDTFDTPEMLGSIFSDELQRGNLVRVEGTLTNTPNILDNNDFYGVGLMAGQSYQVRLDDFQADFDLDGNAVIDDYERTTPVEPSQLAIGVFDPDGRLIATNANLQGGFGIAAESGSAPTTGTNPDVGDVFGFKADRPGIYRIAIGGPGDFTLTGAASLLSQFAYTITVIGVGDIALGAIDAPNSNIFDLPGTGDSPSGITVFAGDLGAVHAAGGGIFSLTLGGRDPMISVDNGNLRAVDAGSLGRFTTNFNSDVTFRVPQGNVGLLRATGVLGGTAVGYTPTLLVSNPAMPIGGSFQLIDGPTVNATVILEANGGLGMLRAASMNTANFPSSIKLNVDKSNDNDGVLDLIDVTGDIGNIAVGGPQISTGPGGNVRYIRCGGNIFRDVLFNGNSGDEDQIISPGESATITDDSGAKVTLKATGTAVPNPDFNPSLPQDDFIGLNEPMLGARMFVTLYPIRDSGGSVIVDVVSESGLDVSVSGAATAEISRIAVQGIGEEAVEGVEIADPDSTTGKRSNLILDPGTATVNVPAANTARMKPEDLTVRVHGDTLVDVLSVVVLESGGADTQSSDNVNANQLDSDGAIAFVGGGRGGTTLGNAVSIINDTGGEIVNVVAQSVGSIVAHGDIGLPKNHTGAAVQGIEDLFIAPVLGAGTRSFRADGPGTVDLGLLQPFNGVKEGITISAGNLNTIRSDGAIGNVVVYGTIGEIIANDDGTTAPGRFDGITGNIVADFFQGADSFFPGRILRTRIGDGIAPSGTGDFSFAGLYARATIGTVSGTDADIRGDIIATGVINLTRTRTTVTVTNQVGQTTTSVTETGNVPTTPIGTIRLDNGSIVNSDILVTGDFGDGRDSVGAFTFQPELPRDNIDRPIYEMGRILITGNGGIIGTRFIANDIGSVVTGPGTFGILNSSFRTSGDGVVQRLEANGYGLRDVSILGGRVISIAADGDGTSLSTNAINERVRFSEKTSSDPVIGNLNPFSFDTPNTLTDIHSVLGTVTFDPNNNQPVTTPELAGVTDTGVIETLNASGQADLKAINAFRIRGDSHLDFANSIGTLQTRDVINGLEITTGTMKTFAPVGDVFNLDMNVRGRLKKVDIKGSLAGNSSIKTVGTGGKIDNLNVGGNLIGSVTSQTSIKSITIGGDFTGNITLTGGGTALKLLKVGGAFLGGSFDITGNVSTIQTAGSLGQLGDTLTINGNLNKLLVGGDLRSNVHVTGSVKTFQVNASIVDGGVEDGVVILVDNTLNSLIVGNDIQSGVKIQAKAIKRQSIGGQNLGEIVLA